MDVSSGAAVAALLFDIPYSLDQRHLRQESRGSEPLIVLDLCCAPGLKLCMLADMLEKCPPSNCTYKRDMLHLAVGVDISPSRLNICQNILHKYFVDHQTSGRKVKTLISSESEPPSKSYTQSPVLIQLYSSDGTTFGMRKKDETESLESLHKDGFVWDSVCSMEEELQCFRKAGEKRKRKNKSARSRERLRLKDVVTNSRAESQLFSRVLVDAECSTDGAVWHLQHKMKKQQKIDFEDSEYNCMPVQSSSTKMIQNKALTDETELTKLIDLQKRLIESGFRLLKPSGIMVYSTCSLSHRQNEQVVSHLLSQNKGSATIFPIKCLSIDDQQLVQEGSIPGTVRFLPNLETGPSSSSQFGGGFFLARIKKLA